MTAKEFVKLKYPNAISERKEMVNIEGIKEIYWEIKPTIGFQIYISRGKTESNAWVNAKNYLK